MVSADGSVRDNPATAPAPVVSLSLSLSILNPEPEPASVSVPACIIARAARTQHSAHAARTRTRTRTRTRPPPSVGIGAPEAPETRLLLRLPARPWLLPTLLLRLPSPLLSPLTRPENPKTPPPAPPPPPPPGPPRPPRPPPGPPPSATPCHALPLAATTPAAIRCPRQHQRVFWNVARRLTLLICPHSRRRDHHSPAPTTLYARTPSSTAALDHHYHHHPLHLQPPFQLSSPSPSPPPASHAPLRLADLLPRLPRWTGPAACAPRPPRAHHRNKHTPVAPSTLRHRPVLASLLPLSPTPAAPGPATLHHGRLHAACALARIHLVVVVVYPRFAPKHNVLARRLTLRAPVQTLLGHGPVPVHVRKGQGARD